jgi:MFS transporter, DHA1 family, inner membrane transport protein
MPLLFVLSIAAFVSAFSIRILDPLVPSMARDLGVLVGTAAMLAPAYTFPYALSQPVLGAIGDQLGKERIIKICLAMLALSLLAAAVANNYTTLFIARCCAGMAGGGIIPVSFAIIGDRFAVNERQVALAQLVMASQIAILLSAGLSGLIAAQLGWRAVFALAAAIAAVSYVTMTWALPGAVRAAPLPPLSLEKVRSQYGLVLSNPLARVILPAAAVEGMVLFGLLPFVAHRLEHRNHGGIVEAGLVLAAMSIGGIAFTLSVGRLIRQLGREGVFRAGGVISCVAMTGIAYNGSWVVEAAFFALLGFGFFMIHNSLQLQATELAPQARASSVAMFAFCFFLGQAVGPLIYHAGFEILGMNMPIMMGGVILLIMAFSVAFRLQMKSATQD